MQRTSSLFQSSRQQPPRYTPRRSKGLLLFAAGSAAVGLLLLGWYTYISSMGGAAAPLKPVNVRWGAASAAYQIEGAYNEDGRGASIWDVFSHTPGKTHNGDTGDVAVDFYHHYEEDIQLMRELGIQMFRLSLSWPRILPDGTGKANSAGLSFYSRVIDALLAAGIEPHVTLYHWCLPQALAERYGGWLDERSVEDFATYAAVCFAAFGDRVRHWTTFNEPWSFVFLGYDVGIHAPGRCSDRSRCSVGDSDSEPWIVTHNVLNAHAAAVAAFRRLCPDGLISINLNSEWAEPLTSSAADREAAQRHLDFSLGVFGDPIFLGDYPASVRARVPALPHFTPEQREALLGSADYFALNHYSSRWVADNKDPANRQGTTLLTERKGKTIGALADSDWLYVVPWGLKKLLAYVHDRYGQPEVYITESGCDVPNESALTPPAVLDDQFRMRYYEDYLQAALEAVKEHGVKLRGYFAWSILDNFEWADGYAKRFGIVYVDYRTQQRLVKKSARWLRSFFTQS